MTTWKRRILEKLGWHFIVFEDCRIMSHSRLVSTSDPATFTVENVRVEIAQVTGTWPNHPGHRVPSAQTAFTIVESYPPSWYQRLTHRLKHTTRMFHRGPVAQR